MTAPATSKSALADTQTPAAERTALRVDCYSEGEGRLMAKSQRWRAKALKPVLSACAKMGISPNHITLLSLVSGIAFAPTTYLG